MRGYDRLPTDMTAVLVGTGLLLIPALGLWPLVGILAAIVTSAACLKNLK